MIEFISVHKETFITLYKATLTLFLILDAFGNIPAYISILSRYDAKRRKIIIVREMLIALAVLIVFLLFGRYLLFGLNLSQAALGISGGVLLFFISIKMIFPDDLKDNDLSIKEEPMIVPLAVPLVAGPSAIAMVILFSTQYPDKMFLWIIAIIASWILSAVILLLSDFFVKILGPKAVKAIGRLMGMLLTAMAVQMLLSGIKQFIVSSF